MTFVQYFHTTGRACAHQLFHFFSCSYSPSIGLMSAFSGLITVDISPVGNSSAQKNIVFIHASTIQFAHTPPSSLQHRTIMMVMVNVLLITSRVFQSYNRPVGCVFREEGDGNGFRGSHTTRLDNHASTVTDGDMPPLVRWLC